MFIFISQKACFLHSDIMLAWSRWVCTASTSPLTFPVVLSGCQVDGQVDDDELSPQLRHVGCPHTQIDSHKWTSQRWVKMLRLLCSGISHALLSFTVFIFLSSPPSWHPPSSPSLSLFLFFFISVCVCSPLRPGCLGSHLEIIRILGSACPLGWTCVSVTGWQLHWPTGSVTERLSNWLDNCDWLTGRVADPLADWLTEP